MVLPTICVNVTYSNTIPALPIEVQVQDTVHSLKLKLSQRQGIPPHMQRLYYGAKVLDDSRSLAEYGIKNNASILLVLDRTSPTVHTPPVMSTTPMSFYPQTSSSPSSSPTLNRTHSPMPCGCPTGSTNFPRNTLRNLPSSPDVITVFDPLNKQPYSLSFCGMAAYETGEHSEVLPTVGLSTYFEAKGSSANKRFFLCKQFQNMKCRAHYNCNSIHACRLKVSEMRTQHPPTKEALEADVHLPVLSEADGETFLVAMDKTDKTAGRDQLLQQLRLWSSTALGKLCQDHEMRPPRCTDVRCPRIHVDYNHMKHVRDMWRQPCCGDAGCIGERAARETKYIPLGDRTEWVGFVLLESQGSQKMQKASATHPKTMLGNTKGLRELCAKVREFNDNNTEVRDDEVYLRIPPGKLCRPHQRKACKWGTECNNIHVCRKAKLTGLATPVAGEVPPANWGVVLESSPTTSPRSTTLHHGDSRVWVSGTPSTSSQVSPSTSPRNASRALSPSQGQFEPVPMTAMAGSVMAPLQIGSTNDHAMLSLLGNLTSNSKTPSGSSSPSPCPSEHSRSSSPVSPHHQQTPQSTAAQLQQQQLLRQQQQQQQLQQQQQQQQQLFMQLQVQQLQLQQLQMQQQQMVDNEEKRIQMQLLQRQQQTTDDAQQQQQQQQSQQQQQQQQQQGSYGLADLVAPAGTPGSQGITPLLSNFQHFHLPAGGVNTFANQRSGETVDNSSFGSRGSFNTAMLITSVQVSA